MLYKENGPANIFPFFFRHWGGEGGNEKNNNDKSNFGDFWGGTLETAIFCTLETVTNSYFGSGTFHTVTQRGIFYAQYSH